jgi:Phage tail assembly chaperone protein
MSNWAYVENNEVLELHWGLPDSWQNISNFSALQNDLPTLNSLGWYPVQVTTSDLGPNQIYGATTYTFDPVNNTVIQNTAIIDNPMPDPAIVFQDQRTQFLQQLRQQRDVLLSACDWTMLSDVLAMHSAEWMPAWASYRQSLRNLPEVYAHPPYDQETNYNNIQWPAVPDVTQL